MKSASDLDWLTSSSAEDTRYYAAKSTDMPLLLQALEIVQKKGAITKAKLIEARIIKLQKTKGETS
ncbi:MAG: hypothetical protein HZB62_10645 [Nitrospirae bacterium]|nr:hypothetical protein [Nitrospirota bacterium]